MFERHIVEPADHLCHHLCAARKLHALTSRAAPLAALVCQVPSHACARRLVQQGMSPLESIYLPRIHTQLLPEVVPVEDWATLGSSFHMPPSTVQVPCAALPSCTQLSCSLLACC